MTCRSWSVDQGRGTAGRGHGRARHGRAQRCGAFEIYAVVDRAALPRLMIGKALNPADIKTFSF